VVAFQNFGVKRAPDLCRYVSTSFNKELTMKMNAFKIRPFYIMLMVIISFSQIDAQQSNKKRSMTFDDYRIVQYISSAGYDPIKIMRLDNNGDLLLACKKGKTKEQLHGMNILVGDSQIRLLEVYDLLLVEDQVLKTAFPILDAEQIGQIRAITKHVTPELAENLTTDVMELVNHLSKTGREKNTYSILFAYIVDGMIWSDFENMKLANPIHINTEHPFWSGEVWAFYPPRKFSCGTNTWTEDQFLFKINWSRLANPVLRPFYKEMRKLDDEMFKQFVKTGYIEDADIKNAFSRFGIFDDSGKLLIPTIVENENNELYRMSRRISKKIAEKVTQLLSLEKLKTEYGFRDIQQTLVVVYHELMWDLMDEFEKKGIVDKPILFTNPDKATSKNVADISFIVQGKESH
jgi:hypothetical protein